MSNTYVVASAHAGVRLDVFLVQVEVQGSRAAAQRLIEQGLVRVNGSAAKSSLRLKTGDRVTAEVPLKAAWEGAALEPWEYPVRTLYEDDSILAVEKPAGMVTHPGAGNRNRTLVNAMIRLRPELRGIGHELRPGVVHRLDRETSGVLLLAKSEAAYLSLSRMFKDRRIEKHYRALAFGAWPAKEGRIEKPLGRDAHDRKKISVRARRTRDAVTLLRVLKQGGCASLLDVRILTGRTHQIRVHLSSENHPIIGDTRYGGANWNRIPDAQLRAELKAAAFFGLHAYSLSFPHPLSGEAVHIECPLPEIWKTAVRILEF